MVLPDIELCEAEPRCSSAPLGPTLETFKNGSCFDVVVEKVGILVLVEGSRRYTRPCLSGPQNINAAIVGGKLDSPESRELLTAHELAYHGSLSLHIYIYSLYTVHTRPDYTKLGRNRRSTNQSRVAMPAKINGFAIDSR